MSRARLELEGYKHFTVDFPSPLSYGSILFESIAEVLADGSDNCRQAYANLVLYRGQKYHCWQAYGNLAPCTSTNWVLGVYAAPVATALEDQNSQFVRSSS